MSKSSVKTMNSTDAERFLPREMRGVIALEHWHRYLFASQFTSGKVILDVACGDGYGSDYLALNARHVYGVDISESTIVRAKELYRRANLDFKIGSCAAVPLEDRSVDVVVSFETIEHHDAHDAMMSELKRVLKPNGVLIISSPDKREYSERISYHNPFHVKELLQEEFRTLLKQSFRNVRLLGQRVVFGSVLAPEKGRSLVTRFIMRDGEPPAGVGLEPVYWVALASDNKLPESIGGILDNAQLLGQASANLGRDKSLAGFVRAVAGPESKVLLAALTGDWYARNNADVFATGVDPGLHWFNIGSGEGRLPASDLGALFEDLLAERVELLHSRLYEALNAARTAERELIAAFREREDQFRQQLDALRADAQHTRHADRESAQRQLEAHTAEAQLREQQWRQQLEEALARIAEQESQFRADVERAREFDRRLGQQQLEAQAADARSREQKWSEQLEEARGRLQEQEDLFVNAVRAQEEQFRQHVAALRIEAERERAQQIEVLARDFAGRERELCIRAETFKDELEGSRRKLDEITTAFRSEIAKLRVRARYEVESVLRASAKETEQSRRQFDALRADAECARRLGQQQLEAQATESLLREQQLKGESAEAYQLIKEEKQIYFDALRSREEHFRRQEQAWREQLRAESERGKEQERTFVKSLKDREEHFGQQLEAARADAAQARMVDSRLAQRQLDAHATEFAQRESSLKEQLRAESEREEEQERTFVKSLKDREEHFGQQLEAARADAAQARMVDSRLAQRQLDAHATEFAQRESSLNGKIGRLKGRLAEFENTWLWRLRCVFVPAQASAGDFDDFDHTHNAAQSATIDGQTPRTLSELLGYQDEEFIQLAYHVLLGRSADLEGHAHYVERLRNGISKLDIVWVLRMSQEGRAYKSNLDGLGPAMRRLRWRRIPIVGHFLRNLDDHKALVEVRNTLLNELGKVRAEVVELESKCTDCNSALRDFVEFDPKAYLSLNEDVATAEINPYEHYIRFGYAEKRQTHSAHDSKTAILSCDWLSTENRQLSTTDNMSVDIVIPIFNGYDFLGPLFESVISNTRQPYRLILVDDCSTDHRVSELLRGYVSRFAGAIVLTNETNQGFIGSVNKAVGFVKSEFFVLLNSDTEVPPGWLERLIPPLQLDTRVATVTPFSNAATICSFPTSTKDNPLYLGLSVNQIDNAFSSIGSATPPIEIPTGVGFCMAMRTSAIEQIGGFDPIYGRGYGEENDWCMRAAKYGYRHVLAVNLFVYHKHGGSFQSEEKARLVRDNLETLSNRYPDYHALVRAHIVSDPAASIREFVKLILLAEASGGATLVVDHGLGGGANSFRRGLVDSATQAGKIALILIHDARQLVVIAHTPEGETRFSLPNVEALSEFLKVIAICEVIYNNLVGSEDPLAIIRILKGRVEALSLPLTVMLHDFYPVCASYTLVDKAGRYCGVPKDLDTCAKCINEIPTEFLLYRPKRVDVGEWRAVWREFMQLAKEVRCFSESSKEILTRAFPELAPRCSVIPHRVDYNPGRLPKIRRTGSMRIGVVGGINYAKGRAILEALIEHIDRRKLAYKVFVIGETDIPVPGVTVTGRYELGRLPEILEELAINVILIPSIWPETFSYVTSEMMILGMPIACFDIGAPAERVKNYEKGIVLEGFDPESILTGLLEICPVELHEVSKRPHVQQARAGLLG